MADFTAKAGNAPAPATDSNRFDDEYDPAADYFTLTAGEDVAKFGMRYVKTEVVHVAPGGWAEQNKIEIDDEIWKVNGVSFPQMSDEDRLKVLTGPKPITIEFKRPKIKDTYYEVECHDIRLGMRYVRNTITEVKAGGWALKNNVQVGDQLIQLNERLFEKLTEDQVLKILAGPRPLKLQFKRPAQQHLDNAAIRQSQVNGDEVNEFTNQEKDIVIEEEKAGGGLMNFLCCQAPARK